MLVAAGQEVDPRPRSLTIRARDSAELDGTTAYTHRDGDGRAPPAPVSLPVLVGQTVSVGDAVGPGRPADLQRQRLARPRAAVPPAQPADGGTGRDHRRPRAVQLHGPHITTPLAGAGDRRRPATAGGEAASSGTTVRCAVPGRRDGVRRPRRPADHRRRQVARTCSPCRRPRSRARPAAASSTSSQRRRRATRSGR